MQRVRTVLVAILLSLLPFIPVAPITQTTVTAQSNWYYGVVAEAANYYGVSADYLWSVVGCETGYTYDPNTGWNTGEDGSPAGTTYGPFQFNPQTYASFAQASGRGGSYTNPTDQAWVAAWAFDNGLSYHWRCA